jgi:hypothetical protein
MTEAEEALVNVVPMICLIQSSWLTGEREHPVRPPS